MAQTDLNIIPSAHPNGQKAPIRSGKANGTAAKKLSLVLPTGRTTQVIVPKDDLESLSGHWWSLHQWLPETDDLIRLEDFVATQWEHHPDPNTRCMDAIASYVIKTDPYDIEHALGEEASRQYPRRELRSLAKAVSSVLSCMEADDLSDVTNKDKWDDMAASM